jgi:hypothetical protein
VAKVAQEVGHRETSEVSDEGKHERFRKKRISQRLEGG